jgi:hypothetical protein
MQTEQDIMITPAEHAVRLTTTLNRLWEARACSTGYATLLAGIGGPSFDHDAPINLLTILQTNGVEDCLWALCATEQNCDKVARLMAADFAEAVLPIYEKDYPNDMRPRAAINATRAFALGKIRAAARDAAWAAARDAAWAAAGDAAWDAARDAAGDAAGAAARAAARVAAGAAARDAARDAAGAAAWPCPAWAAAWDAQAAIVKQYLLP